MLKVPKDVGNEKPSGSLFQNDLKRSAKEIAHYCKVKMKEITLVECILQYFFLLVSPPICVEKVNFI